MELKQPLGDPSLHAQDDIEIVAGEPARPYD